MPIMRYKDLCLDTLDPAATAPFWAVALGLRHERLDDGDARLVDDAGATLVWINRVPEPKTVKNRLHLDISTQDVNALVAAGARVLDDTSFSWIVMADPEGHEFCAFVRTEPITNRMYAVAWDCRPGAEASREIAGWWAHALGARLVDDEQGYSYLADVPGSPWETFDFVSVPESKTVKNRVHIDVFSEDVDGLIASGATLLRGPDQQTSWHVLADPDGNEFCVFRPEPSRG